MTGETARLPRLGTARECWRCKVELSHRAAKIDMQLVCHLGNPIGLIRVCGPCGEYLDKLNSAVRVI